MTQRRLLPVLLAVMAAVCRGASPVIDDAALEEGFTAGLAEPGIEGINGAQALKMLEAAEGRRVRIDAMSVAPGASDYASACRAVVVIGSVEKCRKCTEQHMGAVSSGWIIDPRGWIVTNYHVLEDKTAGEIGVLTFDGKVFPVRGVLAADREGDAAVLEIDPRGAELTALRLAGGAETGERIRVIGHPDGRFFSLTEGIVSRVFTEETAEGDGRRTWLTVTADYGGGSSGAPVLNAAGEVSGMVSSTAALLADPEEGQEPAASDVQMVFRDCVSAETIRRLLAE